MTKLDLVQTAPGSARCFAPTNSPSASTNATERDASREPRSLSVSLEGERASVDEAIGKKCPHLVFPNEEDFGYAMVNLDPKSLEVAKTSLARIADPFTRHLLAFTLWKW